MQCNNFCFDYFFDLFRILNVEPFDNTKAYNENIYKKLFRTFLNKCQYIEII